MGAACVGVQRTLCPPSWCQPSSVLCVGCAPCRYTREAEAAAAAEDERRKAVVKAGSKVLAASLAEQLVLKESLKHAHDGEEQVSLFCRLSLCCNTYVVWW